MLATNLVCRKSHSPQLSRQLRDKLYLDKRFRKFERAKGKIGKRKKGKESERAKGGRKNVRKILRDGIERSIKAIAERSKLFAS